jgi:hypothetical protein
VNARFREFTLGGQPLTGEFYSKLKAFLQEVLKVNNEVLEAIVNGPRET